METMLRWGLPLVAALLLAGCGGAAVSSKTGAGAAIAPANAVVYASVGSDLNSDQWNRLESLVARFPDGGTLVTKIRQSLADEGIDFDRDVAPALGPTVEVVALAPDEGSVVVLTQPDDEQALRDALAKANDPPVVGKLDGWVAVAQDQAAIDKLRTALEQQGPLADSDRYRQAMDGLPDDALARVYVDVPQVAAKLPQAAGAQTGVETVGAALVAGDDGVRLEARARTAEGVDLPQPGGLIDRVPESAYAFLAFGGGGRLDLGSQLAQSPQLKQALDAITARLGVDVEELAGLAGGDGVLYVAPGTLIPEVTLVLSPDDADAAVATVDKLARGLGASPTRRRVEGVAAREVSLGGFVSLYYGAVDGKLVVSTASSALGGPSGGSIEDSGRYRDALDAAGVGDGEQVLLYVDTDEALRLADQLAGLAGNVGGLPENVRGNLEHLSSLVVASGIEGRTATARVFLGVD